MKLKNKVAFITGGGSGIGAASARHMATEGAKIAVVGIPAEGVEQVAAELRADGFDYSWRFSARNVITRSRAIDCFPLLRRPFLSPPLRGNRVNQPSQLARSPNPDSTAPSCIVSRALMTRGWFALMLGSGSCCKTRQEGKVRGL